MAFNTKVDVADTEFEANEAVAAEAEDVTLEDETLVEAESEDEADEDDEEAGRVRGLADLFQRRDREDRRHGHPRGAARSGHEG